jgi:hypothetical protein
LLLKLLLSLLLVELGLLGHISLLLLDVFRDLLLHRGGASLLAF